MKIFPGTSGFGYKEWKGSFYPRELPARDMLAYYATRLPSVELNSTFYRLPTAEVLRGWAGDVPAGFRFTVKAPRRITHLQRLASTQENVSFVLEALSNLGDRLRAVLFQLPPTLRKDLPRLRSFLDLLPTGTEAAFEFRHPSWYADEVSEVLAARGFPLCTLESDELAAPLVPTARWGYLKLRRSGYDGAELREWLDRIRRQPWDEAYVFFKHEEGAKGPGYAARLMELAGPDAHEP